MSLKSDYYDTGGSSEVATVSALTLKKLEQRRTLTTCSERLVIVLVGLPGRGKSFIARKLHSFMNWRGTSCRIFNVGKYRRQAQADFMQSHAPIEDDTLLAQSDPKSSTNNGSCDANFFDFKNSHAAAIRQAAADAAMKDMLCWLDAEHETQADEITLSGLQSNFLNKKRIRGDRIAIFDATNSSVERRNWVLEECTSPAKRHGKATGVIFVESICDDQELLDENFRFKVQNSPDYEGIALKDAIADLRSRVKKYEEMYETIDDDQQSYIKIFNLSSKLLVNHIYGRIAKIIVPSLMSWNIGSRPIYLCRSGETEKEGKVGEKKRSTCGNKLGQRGILFRNNLAKFIEKEGYEMYRNREHTLKEAFMPTQNATGTSIGGLAEKDDTEVPFSCHVMSSTMPRAIDTASWKMLPFYVNELPNLNPLDKGDFSGMELDEIKEKNPEWYARLKNDSFLTRFPGGECYADLIHRLETCIIDMEQQISMVAVVSHVSVVQVLISYFRRSPVAKSTSVKVPMNTVIKFSPKVGGGWVESQHNLLPSYSTVDNINSSNSNDKLIDSPIWGDQKKRLS